MIDPPHVSGVPRTPAPGPVARRRPRDVRRLSTVLLVILALLPLGYIGLRALEAGRNFAYWDEYETAIALVLRLHNGIAADDLLDELLAVNNEHRMVMSRLIFTGSYWLTGTVNFTFISLLGNASLVALCVLLIVRAGTAARRLRLGVVLALVIFQLENYENFLWSGSSIDHFQVLLYVGAAVVALAHGSRLALFAAGLFAVFATLTLAHGLLIWPLGAAMLWRARRYSQLGAWCVLAGLVVGGYAAGFSVNGAHRFAGLSVSGAVEIIRYWLTLLGAVPAIGHTGLAPWLGVVLLALLVWLGSQGALRREAVAYPLAWFGVAALALVAVGRAEQVGGAIMSRYVIVGALSWSLTVFMLLERSSHPRRPLAVLAWSLPVLVAFNFAANRTYGRFADAWLECRDIAVSRFKQHGVDGRGTFALSPMPERATRLLHEAELRGIYRLGSVCEPRPFPAAKPSSRIVYNVDELTADRRSAFVRGWAGIPGVPTARGDILLILRSPASTHVFTTVSTQRPDVATSLNDQNFSRSGFLFARRRDRLPSGDYRIGFVIKCPTGPEYIMTEHRVVLDRDGRALLAGAQ
jgi:hypothetical protein